ncbi:HAD-IIB family hydrolase [Hahella sp. KA22]|uniref:HAD-IIB family hydrolase n=1 Tax=Hahella sp. KA22 TaxID=1628392 RepID=UPI000FDD2DF2|nr:HAD-IIB family hydrolase [Hahella sp. KA22]AZZ89882.1 HAD-IIB family hydrolase [Hahella sp. KA22]QAY53251.1 HAD-IIB family hydrolase [Hahella sp. KA22]
MSQLIIYTDLDGTLLDHHTYAADSALPTLAKLKQWRIPCVWNTSKTYAELRALRQRLHHQDPFIVENGAAVYLPKSQFQEPFSGAHVSEEFYAKTFGPSRQHILDVLQEFKGSYGFKSFYEMDAETVASLTGLSKADAALAKQREFTEPLVWEDSPTALKQFTAELNDTGLQILRGGRFLHVMGQFNKATAMQWLTELYAERCGETPVSMALGDSHNDIAMLNAADIAVVVRSPSHLPPSLERKERILTKKFGPEGWAEAVEQVLASQQSLNAPSMRS